MLGHAQGVHQINVTLLTHYDLCTYWFGGSEPQFTV
jgi:hypothetical protein